MMTAEARDTTEDGDLIGARRRLTDAISKLTDSRPEVVEGHTYWLDSHYTELRDALPGDQGSGHGVARSLPPLFVDAADLLNEIDVAVACWEPRPVIPVDEDDLPHMTVLRLRSIERNGCRGIPWRPQDASKAEQIAANIQEWVLSIETLLRPVPAWSLPNPCPACQTAIVYRKDASGDMVRKPALSIGPNGCVCIKCHAEWAPNRFIFLAKVLGYEFENGILE